MMSEIGRLTIQACCAGVWLHGEAVAAGMVMAADMSHRLGWIDGDILERTTALLQRAQLPTVPPEVWRMCILLLPPASECPAEEPACWFG